MQSTSQHRRLTATALALLSASALAAAPAGAATPVETLTAASPVAAFGGISMWSRLDPATGKYQLVRSVDAGVPTVVNVPQRDGAFDVDLGANAAGSTYAVYSRAGDIYRLNPRTAIEKKLAISSPTRVERSPSIWRGRIAFVRRDHGIDQVRVGDAKRSRVLLERKAIEAVDLGDKHVGWTDRLTAGLASSKYRVHVRKIATGKDRIVYQAGGGGASFTTVTRPSVAPDGSSFLWAVARKGAAGSRIVRYTLGTGKLSYAKGTPRYASMAWVSDELGAIISNNSAGDPNAGAVDCGCSVEYTGPLSFDLKP